jgi:hypothetical protein
VTDEGLPKEFADWADEALALAATATLPQVCVWPDCLTVEQELQLADEIGCELIGEAHPEPAVHDQAATCRCTESGR